MGKRAYHPTKGHKKEDRARPDLGKADTPSRTGAFVGRQRETSGGKTSEIQPGTYVGRTMGDSGSYHPNTGTQKGKLWETNGATRPERWTPPLRETYEGRQMKGDKAQTKPERRTPPLRKICEDRQIKGNKAQTRPQRRIPPLKETRKGRQMKGDK